MYSYTIVVHVISGKPNSLHDTEEGDEDGMFFI